MPSLFQSLFSSLLVAGSQLSSLPHAAQTPNTKINSKVLDFVQFGGPSCTELRTFSWEVTL